MAKSLADLRTQKPKTLPTREIPVCLDWDLTNEMVRLQTELEDIKVAAIEAREKTNARPKMAQGSDPRTEEIEQKLRDLLDKQREETAVLTVRAIPSGEWALWKDEHPARWTGTGDDRTLNESDRQIGYGLLDSTALLGDLGRWLYLWEGEQVDDSDRDTVLDAISPGDKNEICRKVILLQEGSTTLAPKSQSASSTMESSAAS